MKPIYSVHATDHEPSVHAPQTKEGLLTLLATSSASWSGVSRTYAFFFPSGLHPPIRNCTLVAGEGRMLTG